MFVLAGKDVERVLPVGDCIDVMAQSLKDLTNGVVAMPLRTAFRVASVEGRAMAWMPAFRHAPESTFASKVLCLVAANPARGLDAHRGVVVLFDGETGEPTAIVDAAAITRVRTAAVSALATRELARVDGRRLVCIGAGVQAEAHIHALALVRELASVTVISRTQESAQRLAERLRLSVPYAVEVSDDPERAVRQADIVVTATTANEPVISREWVSPGTHLNAVGMGREIDGATVAASEMYCDRRESLIAEGQEFRLAVEEGLIDEGDVRGEIGEVIAGKAPRRSSDTAITLFRSLGLACEDTYAAQCAVSRARAMGVGQEVLF